VNILHLSTLVCATDCYVCLSHGEGVVPVHLDGYTNVYPVLNRFTNTLHVFACHTMICLDRRWPILILLAPFLDIACRKHSIVLCGITRLFPIDRTNGYDHSYRSLANNPFGSSPTPFPSIVHSYRILGVFPDRGSLTKVDTSREFIASFRYPIL